MRREGRRTGEGSPIPRPQPTGYPAPSAAHLPEPDESGRHFLRGNGSTCKGSRKKFIKAAVNSLKSLVTMRMRPGEGTVRCDEQEDTEAAKEKGGEATEGIYEGSRNKRRVRGK